MEFAVIIILLNQQVCGIYHIDPLKGFIRTHLLNIIIHAFAVECIRNNRAFYIRSAEKADGFIQHRGDPIRMPVVTDLKIRGIQKFGRILETNMADQFFIKQFRGAVLDAGTKLLHTVYNRDLL